MTKTELGGFRDDLLALRNRHNGDVSHLTDEALSRTGGGATGNLSKVPIHMADLGTDNFEQEFTLSLLQNEEQLLEEIAAGGVAAKPVQLVDKMQAWSKSVHSEGCHDSYRCALQRQSGARLLMPAKFRETTFAVEQQGSRLDKAPC